jgi:hypothetical protein
VGRARIGRISSGSLSWKPGGAFALRPGPHLHNEQGDGVLRRLSDGLAGEELQLFELYTFAYRPLGAVTSAGWVFGHTHRQCSADQFRPSAAGLCDVRVEALPPGSVAVHGPTPCKASSVSWRRRVGSYL